MVNFLRKNIIFFSVCGLILLVSIVLAVVDVMMMGEIQETNSKITASNAEVESLLEPRNKVAEGNAEKIQNDAEFTLAEARKLQRRFCQPNRKYFLDLMKDLGVKEEKEDELRALFRKHFEEYEVVRRDGQKENMQAAFRNFTSPPDRVFYGFMDAFKAKLALYLEPAKEGEDAEKRKPSAKMLARVDEAFKGFIEGMIRDHVTVEDLARCTFMDDVKRIHYDIIAEAFGLPRIMQPYQCKSYLEAMQIAFSNQRVIPGVTSLEKIREFTFADYQTNVPANSDVPGILLSMRIYEDVFRFLRRVAELEILSLKLTPPAPNSDRYQKYRCSVTFNAPLSSVRDFVNLLHDAYKDNRVCVVRWVSVKGSSDKELEELKKILAPGGSSGNTAVEEPAPRRNRFRRNRRFQVQNVRNQNERSNLIAPYLDPYNEAYARTIVGKNRKVEAEIDFEYIIYTGDQIYKHSNSN